MSDIKILVKMPEKMYEWVNNVNKFYADYRVSDFVDVIKNGTSLPKSHGDLFDKTELLSFLQCPKYEHCDWKNCFDCNESRCINLNNINDLVPLIKADECEEESDYRPNYVSKTITEQKLELLEYDLGAGKITKNKAREELNLPPIESEEEK